jgi:hypothetical protein
MLVTLTKECHMFEAELEMEKKQGGGFGPLLIILLLVGLVVGGLGYVIWQGKQTLKPEEAAQLISTVMAEKGQAAVRFHSGLVTYDVNDTTTDPHYRLLSKLGIVITKPAKNGALQVDLTPQGEQRITAIPEFKKTTDKKGVTAYKVPLASKDLVKVEKVTWMSPTSAQIEYLWKWKPNDLGKEFDASSPVIKGFQAYDRATLIQKYGVDFYSADPIRETVRMTKKDGKWQMGD